MSTTKGHTCPVWAGYLLICPLRKLFHNPRKILSAYVRRGMTVLDVGSAMGFFSLPAAEMVGPEGRVIAVDIQPQMLQALKKRAERLSLSERIETVVATEQSLGIDSYHNSVDVVILFAVVHEVANPESLFRQLAEAVRAGGIILLAEPRGHVPAERFEAFVKMAESNGFVVEETLKVFLSRAVVMKKKQNST